MAFNNNFTDELRARLSIVDVVGRRVPLKKKGNQYWGCCPFHNEKTPSFSVREDWGKYKCFGCGESGDIISFVMKTQNLEFRVAIEELANMAGLKMPDYKPKDAATVQREQSYADVYEQTTKLYQQKLFEESGRVALDYIRSRGFSDEVIKKYRLGYAPRGNFVAAKFSGQKTASMIATGLVRQSDDGRVYDFFRDKLMFPIMNSKGTVIAFSGRSLDGSEPKYINTGETELFHKKQTVFGLSFARDAIHRANRSIVVEGQIDAIQMQTHGFGETVAPLGTALTADHLAILCKHNRNIIFCFDGDTAGQKAAARAQGLIMPMLRDNSDVKFVFMPAKSDPDDILRGKDGTERMKKIIDSASPLVDFLWDLANKNFMVATPGGRAQAEKFLRAETDKITDPALKREYENQYNQLKFNNWRKWKTGEKSIETAVPSAGSITRNTVSEIAVTYPELIERHAEFLLAAGFVFEEIENSELRLSFENAEKFIVALKLKHYLSKLQGERKAAIAELTPESLERVKILDQEIKKIQEKQTKLSEI